MSKDMLWLIRKTILTSLKDYKNLLLVIALPIVGILLSTLIYKGSGDTSVTIGIVNHDIEQKVTQDTIDFVAQLEHTEASVIRESEADDLVVSGELDAVLIFPEGFAKGVIQGTPEPVRIESIKGAQVTGYVKSYLNAYVQNISSLGVIAGGDAAAFNELYSGYRSSKFQLSTTMVADQSANHDMTNRTIGYLVVFMLFSAVNLSALTIRDRENRTYYRLLSSPITARSYVFSNAIVNIVLMMIQIAATLFVMTRFFHIEPGIPLWQMFLILSLFALVAVSLSQVIVAFSDSTMMANGIQTMVIMPTSLLAGCVFPLSVMPEAIQRIADFLPQYWLLDTFGKLQQGSGLTDVILNVAILLAFALALSLIATYKFARNRDTQSYI
ncbi:ABC transporter permease [Paenibacillus sp. JNUCC32]|uniref:ABC transporter permease n=1 Tax=Paenibacillus TaxID=44249 RepID=UPI000BBDD248|nr:MULTISPECIES: ABC transporter permease [Paenibacillus]PCL91269.1 ABC transporter permease [Paenibacillus lautus]QOT09559.1 ABC transporter permease [Paenibacillus sp. JNUCC-32]